MTKTFLVLVTVLGISVGKAQTADSSATKLPSAAADKQAHSAEQLEAKFKAMLTKATLSGRWASIKDGKLGEEKEDKYNIVSVSKVNGDSWIVNAKMKYGDREVVAPIPIKVKWAGDTPVIIVDNLTMPGGRNSYSARVLFFEHTYAGTWFGGGHGGLLNGLISNEAEEKSEDSSK
jgi:hypothetical protein